MRVRQYILADQQGESPCKEITINQPVEKIKAANNIARDVQSISKRSKIYTVCKLNHAGGLFAQTLPAYEINAEILIEDFNAFRWVKIIEKFSLPAYEINAEIH